MGRRRSQASSSSRRLIVKYQDNRRLYDCSTNEYTTLTKLLLLAEEGEKFQVMAGGRSQSTPDDITSSILAELLSMRERMRPAVPADTLFALLKRPAKGPATPTTGPGGSPDERASDD